MINQHELRIGNLVIDAKTNQIVTVDGIQFSGRCVVEDIKYDDGKRGIEPEPIPLTSEVLKACGFRQSKNNKYWRKKDEEDLDFGIDKNLDGKTYLHSITNSSGLKVPLVIRYLHQLQNLYFSFTGKELKVNINVEAH